MISITEKKSAGTCVISPHRRKFNNVGTSILIESLVILRIANSYIL